MTLNLFLVVLVLLAGVVNSQATQLTTNSNEKIYTLETKEEIIEIQNSFGLPEPAATIERQVKEKWPTFLGGGQLVKFQVSVGLADSYYFPSYETPIFGYFFGVVRFNESSR